MSSEFEIPWIDCRERVPTNEDATRRGMVEVVWFDVEAGPVQISWKTGIDHFEKAKSYAGWRPL
ncbi:hypothetical protein [Microbulbifer sp. JMSA003]|uniref:hypothetical protein n=1 Tax=unclassified Microbulbifer TaxID=2619833 RepID=UPI004039512A